MTNDIARALDARFLEIVRRYGSSDGTSVDGAGDAAFEALAIDIFAYQIERNEPYRHFAAALGTDRDRLPRTWRDIPAVPASAFKDATLATFDASRAELVFHTSGTTAETAGKHYIERAALYDASLLASFDRFMLADAVKLRYLNFVPNPREHPRSSLGYMLGHVSVLRGDGKAAYFLEDGRIDVAGFTRALDTAIGERAAVCIAGTAFALVALLDALGGAGRTFAAVPGSRVMETGGFKGRARVVDRAELYARLGHALGIPQHDIVAEYGMTELVSQYYDSPESRTQSVRVKAAPPWLRTLVLDGNGREVQEGEIGFLRHVDLGNRSSAIAIDTEDRGYRTAGGIVLLGREIDAPARGCSLEVEDLASARS